MESNLQAIWKHKRLMPNILALHSSRTWTKTSFLANSSSCGGQKWPYTPHATIALSTVAYVSMSSSNSQTSTKLSHASRKLYITNVTKSIVNPTKKSINIVVHNPNILKCYIHSSDILSIRFKHTRIIRFFGLLKKYLKILDTKANFQAFVLL
jgi:hypothetical protein